ncbi:MAG: two-component system response regulator RegA [Flavobacteriales bacterium]|jgi:two-component system response regulator RegA
MTSQSLLYLEDDPALARVTKKALEKRGFTVYHSHNLAELERHVPYTDFSHVLLDLKVDDGNALSKIEGIIKANTQLKILVLTGYASIASAVQAVKMGAVNYLSKPASADDIIKAFIGEGDSEQREIPAPEGDKMSVRRLEWEHIQRALLENDGNISETARQLKMHRRTLQRKLQKKPVAE